MARQPLVLALADAKMANVDALMFADPNANLRRARHQIEDLKDRIQKEARELFHGATPWEVATALREQIANYVTLFQSLARSSHVLDQEVSFDEIRIAPWHDTLPATPLDDSDSTSDAPMVLSSLDDYEWFVRAFGLDRSEYPVGGISYVPTSILARRVGAAKITTNNSTLRPYVLPSTWERYRRAVEAELGFDPEIALIDVGMSDLDITSDDHSEESADIEGWDYHGVYRPTDRLLLRKKHDCTYQIEMDWSEDSILRFYIDVQDGHCKIALITLKKGGKLTGPVYCDADVEKGVVEVEMTPPGTTKSQTFRFQSGAIQKGRQISVAATGNSEESWVHWILAVYERGELY